MGLEVILVVQEVAKLYTSMSRDLSSWWMPFTWEVLQEGINFNPFTEKSVSFNWTCGCDTLFSVLNTFLILWYKL